jgi:hypothetical protein
MHFTHRALTLLFLVVLLFGGAALAQRGNAAIQVEVPFEFEIGNHTLPAGVYTIDHENPYILAIHDARRRVLVTVMAMPAETFAPSSTPKVQFYVEGGHNVLARIWNANSRYGYELSPKRRDATLAESHNSAASASSGR